MSTHTAAQPLAPAPRTRFGDRPAATSSPESRTTPSPALFPNDPTRVEPLRLRRAPLLFAALCFALGELLAVLHPHPTALLLLATVLLLALAALALRNATRTPHRRANLIATLPVAALWMTAGTLAAHLRPSPDPQSALLPYADNLSRTVIGRVTRIRPLPPRAPVNTADSEHTWQPPDPEDSETQAEQVDLQLSRIEFLTPGHLHPRPHHCRHPHHRHPHTRRARPSCPALRRSR